MGGFELPGDQLYSSIIEFLAHEPVHVDRGLQGHIVGAPDVEADAVGRSYQRRHALADGQ